MSTAEQRIEIPISKAKIVLMLTGALAFVALGLWFVISPPAIQTFQWITPATIKIVGYVSIIFFGLCAFFLRFDRWMVKAIFILYFRWAAL